MSKTEPSAVKLSKRTGIPRGTIRDWLQPRYHAKNPMHLRVITWSSATLTPLQERAYVYLLGLYLGDGHISLLPRNVFRLRVFLDNDYPRIITQCARAMHLLFPAQHANFFSNPAKSDSTAVSIYSKQLVVLFPQHGPGKKHLRKIALAPWQEALVIKWPSYFLRGLFHSDGSYYNYTVNQGAYTYDGYEFKNMSDDIRKLYFWACTLVGVTPRYSNLAVCMTRRPGVARLRSLLGTKHQVPALN